MAKLKLDKETTGAWVIHHGRKIASSLGAASEYPAIDQAAKAATLLTRLSETDDTTLSRAEVEAVARASGINPKFELIGLLHVLADKRLIEQSDNSVALLGITTRGALAHGAELFEDAAPGVMERASIHLAERVSESPLRRKEIAEEIGDTHKLARPELKDFLDTAEGIGFVDGEDLGGDRLLFNGNLFRRESVKKATKVLESLSEAEQRKMREANALLQESGCVPYKNMEKILTKPLFEKLRAAGLYDLNIVGNESGEHAYVTAPGAFHKYVNPLIDDCFDLAKSLVAALTYGMTERNPRHGRIVLLELLLQKLIAGREVGSATSIGKDYRVLEMERVVKLRKDPRKPGCFFMRLLKKEVGEMALDVLTSGDATAEALSTVPAAPMTRYIGPEEARVITRKKQLRQSRDQTRDVLEALRGGRSF